MRAFHVITYLSKSTRWFFLIHGQYWIGDSTGSLWIGMSFSNRSSLIEFQARRSILCERRQRPKIGWYIRFCSLLYQRFLSKKIFLFDSMAIPDVFVATWSLFISRMIMKLELSGICKPSWIYYSDLKLINIVVHMTSTTNSASMAQNLNNHLFTWY